MLQEVSETSFFYNLAIHDPVHHHSFVIVGGVSEFITLETTAVDEMNMCLDANSRY